MTIQTNHRTDTLTPSTGELTVSGTFNATDFEKAGVPFFGLTAVGLGTLSGGAVTISEPRLIAGSRIILSRVSTDGAPGAPGHLYVSAVTAGTSFNVNSTNGSDTGTFHFIVVNG
jgi:hypothetical protein